MTYKEQLQRIANDYAESGEAWPASAREIAAWAIRNGRWRPQPNSLIGRCANDIAEAMRDEYMTDPQGRCVRVKHAARLRENPTQLKWFDMRTANRDEMACAFQGRRRQILGDCRQLKTDVDSFNDNRSPDNRIQLVLDFTEDLAELEALANVSSVASPTARPLSARHSRFVSPPRPST